MTETREQEEFLRAHSGALSRLAVVLTRTPDRAEEVLQEAFIRIVRHWPRVVGSADPKTYARRILVNEALRDSRLRWNKQHAPLDDAKAASDRVDTSIEDRDQARRLLATLRPRQRAAIAMRYLEDLSYEEIATVLSCRPATARSLVSRGLQCLRVANSPTSQIPLGGLR